MKLHGVRLDVLTLAGALGEVVGANQVSAGSGANYVIRGTDMDRPKIYHLDASCATGLLLAERFDLQAQDVVLVDTASISQRNRAISQLLPSLSVIGIADGLGTNEQLARYSIYLPRGTICNT